MIGGVFVGHFAVGFAAKRVAPEASLGTLFAAAQFLDLVWPGFVLLGWERVAIEPGNTVLTPLNFEHYPYTHSLVTACVWGLLAGALYLASHLADRDYRTGALVVAALVPSHWILDAVVHRPDLPLWPGRSPLVGLGLWNHPVPELGLELGMFAAGLWIYTRCTRATGRAGSIGLWVLAAVLLAIYLGNLFGPPPPSVAAIGWAGNLMWLFVVWGAWVDRHRSPRP